MSDQNKLTSEEIRQNACATSAQDQRLFYTDVKSYMLGFYNGYDRQAAEYEARIKELEAELKKALLERNIALNDFAQLQFSTIQAERRKIFGK